MPMIETMEKSGHWLFRWRSYLPLVIVALVPAALKHYTYPFGSHRYDQRWELVCLGISLLGFAIRVLTAGYTPRRTSGRNARKQVADSLNTEGIYSVVRNPLYLGNFIVALGPALVLHIWWVPVIYILVFMLYYERIVFAEEVFLRNKFGQQFMDWASRTPVFLPRLTQWRSPGRRFNVRQVLRREHQTLFGIVVVFFLIEMAAEWRLGNPVLGDTMWNVLAGAALVFFLVIRLLRKCTTVLKDKEPEHPRRVSDDTAHDRAEPAAPPEGERP